MCDSCGWEDALDLVEEIESAAEDVPERGEDFAASVLECANSIGDTIEQNEHATPRQMEALENMIEGLMRWTRGGD